MISSVYEPGEPYQGGQMKAPRVYISGWLASGQHFTVSANPNYAADDYQKLLALVNHDIEITKMEVTGQTKNGATKVRFSLRDVTDLGMTDQPHDAPAIAKVGGATAATATSGGAAGESISPARTSAGPAFEEGTGLAEELRALSARVDALEARIGIALSSEALPPVRSEGGGVTTPPPSSTLLADEGDWETVREVLRVGSDGPVLVKLAELCGIRRNKEEVTREDLETLMERLTA